MNVAIPLKVYFCLKLYYMGILHTSNDNIGTFCCGERKRRIWEIESVVLKMCRGFAQY